MKLAVFSDTHGSTEGMLLAALRVAPDVLVHLGDHYRDSFALRSAFPELPLYAVPGNCDCSCREPDPLVFMAGGVTVLATHGHRYSVKYGTDALLNAAYFAGAGLALFGHTHTAVCQDFGGVTLLNPGSAGMGPRPSFAVVEISETGGFSCRILDI